MKNNNKIAIVSASLGVGGAERFAGLLSFMLNDLGYEVHHLIILDHIAYDYKGKVVNLGKLFSKDIGIFRAIKKGKYIANYLYENDIQLIIDNRSRPTFLREVFTRWIYGKRRQYFMIHSANLKLYFPRFGSNFLYKNATKLVCVSQAIEYKVQQNYALKNTFTMHNPIVIPNPIVAQLDGIPEKYILFFGRLEEAIKNFTLLLTGFKDSKVYETGTKLLIVGDGKDRDFIITKINALQLNDHVQLLPFQKNILPFIQQAICTVLTSRFEGFPMSIVESLAAGIPVIAVDCESGPNEIIQNNYNGLLVENHNNAALAEAIYTMINDKKLYQRCKNNAQKSVEHLSLTTIAQQWHQLLQA